MCWVRNDILLFVVSYRMFLGSVKYTVCSVGRVLVVCSVVIVYCKFLMENKKETLQPGSLGPQGPETYTH